MRQTAAVGGRAVGLSYAPHHCLPREGRPFWAGYFTALRALAQPDDRRIHGTLHSCSYHCLAGGVAWRRRLTYACNKPSGALYLIPCVVRFPYAGGGRWQTPSPPYQVGVG